MNAENENIRRIPKGLIDELKRSSPDNDFHNGQLLRGIFHAAGLIPDDEYSKLQKVKNKDVKTDIATWAKVYAETINGKEKRNRDYILITREILSQLTGTTEKLLRSAREYFRFFKGVMFGVIDENATDRLRLLIERYRESQTLLTKRAEKRKEQYREAQRTRRAKTRAANANRPDAPDEEPTQGNAPTTDTPTTPDEATRNDETENAETDDEPTAFTQIYEQHPSRDKSGNDKRGKRSKALKAYQELIKKCRAAGLDETNDYTLAIIHAYYCKDEQWNKDGGQFAPHLRKWLNAHEMRITEIREEIARREKAPRPITPSDILQRTPTKERYNNVPTADETIAILEDDGE